MKTIIFLGPSLPVEKAKQILDTPDTIYLPPAGQADLLSAVTTYKPDVIALIDGVFGQSLSVWHKEILFAIEKGVMVFGASSMGALRAAETSVYGMIGVGQIYEMYSSGEVNDDDEVALIHGPAAIGFCPVSEPMINIRMTFRKSVEDAVVSKELAEKFTGIAKSIFYPHRKYPLIFQKAEEAGIPASDIETMKKFVEKNKVDAKGDDAIELLEKIRDLDKIDIEKEFKMSSSHLFNSMYDMDRTVRHDDFDIELSTVAHYTMLHKKDYIETSFSAKNRGLVEILADMLHVEVSDEEVTKEIKRFQMRNKLKTNDQLDLWINENDLAEEEFHGLMESQAKGRKMHRWYLTRFHKGKGIQNFLNELRLRDEYSHWAKESVKHEKLLQSNIKGQDIDYFNEDMRDLLKSHLTETDCTMDCHFREWSFEANFNHEHDFKHELIKAKNGRNIRKAMIREIFSD